MEKVNSHGKSLKVPAIFQKITPGENMTPEIAKMFEGHLLRIPIFKVFPDKSIKLLDPENPRTILVKAENLLNDLAHELAVFYSGVKNKRNQSFATIQKNLRCASKDLLACKTDLQKIGIKEKSIIVTRKKIENWAQRSVKEFGKNVTPIKRIELIKNLFPLFMIHTPKLSERGVYLILAHILKSLGIERGTIKQIVERMKKDYHRKNKPIIDKGSAYLTIPKMQMQSSGHLK